MATAITISAHILFYLFMMFVVCNTIALMIFGNTHHKWMPKASDQDKSVGSFTWMMNQSIGSAFKLLYRLTAEETVSMRIQKGSLCMNVIPIILQIFRKYQVNFSRLFESKESKKNYHNLFSKGCTSCISKYNRTALFLTADTLTFSRTWAMEKKRKKKQKKKKQGKFHQKNPLGICVLGISVSFVIGDKWFSRSFCAVKRAMHIIFSISTQTVAITSTHSPTTKPKSVNKYTNLYYELRPVHWMIMINDNLFFFFK